jgi:hypothetical protein
MTRNRAGFAFLMLVAYIMGLAGCATFPRRGTAKSPERPAATETQPANPLLLTASCS